MSRNLGTLTSWNPLGLSRPVMGLLYLFFTGYYRTVLCLFFRKCKQLWALSVPPPPPFPETTYSNHELEYRSRLLYGLNSPGFECRWRQQGFLFSKTSRLAVGYTQTPLSKTSRTWSRPLRLDEFKNKWSYAYSPLRLYEVNMENITFDFRYSYYH